MTAAITCGTEANPTRRLLALWAARGQALPEPNLVRAPKFQPSALPILRRPIPAHKADTLGNLRHRMFPIEFILNRNIAVESLRF